MPDLSSKKLLDELKKYNTTVKQNNKEKKETTVDEDTVSDSTCCCCVGIFFHSISFSNGLFDLSSVFDWIFSSISSILKIH